MQRSKLQKAEDGLRKLWGNDEHYGIPEEHRTSELTIHRAQVYRALCELVSRSPLQLDQLWTLEPRFIPTAFQKHRGYNFSKAVNLAKQAILASWKNTDLETYGMEMSRGLLKRPALSATRDRRPTGTGPRGKKRRLRRPFEMSDDENSTSASESKCEDVNCRIEEDRSDAGDIDPNESDAERAISPLGSAVSSAMAIPDSEYAEDVHGHSPELDYHRNTPPQNVDPLQLVHEVMAMNSRSSDEEADKLIQTKQQLELLRDRKAQLEERLQNTSREIDQLHEEEEKLQARSRFNHDIRKKLEQVAEALVIRSAGDGDR